MKQFVEYFNINVPKLYSDILFKSNADILNLNLQDVQYSMEITENPRKLAIGGTKKDFEGADNTC